MSRSNPPGTGKNRETSVAARNVKSLEEATAQYVFNKAYSDEWILFLPY
jgi:hypothetical protein